MIIDPGNLPTQPDSSLDSDLATVQKVEIQPDPNDGQILQNIAVGDWVDIDPAVGMSDPVWGYSFQVMTVYPSAVGVLYSPDGGNMVPYFETQVSFAALTDNFRRVPRG